MVQSVAYVSVSQAGQSASHPFDSQQSCWESVPDACQSPSGMIAHTTQTAGGTCLDCHPQARPLPASASPVASRAAEWLTSVRFSVGPSQRDPSPVEVSEVALATLDHDGEVAQALVQALRRLALHLVAQVHVEGSPVGGPLHTASCG